MCLIVFTPNMRRATIRRAVLERGFSRNHDGAGFAYVEKGDLHISKAFYAFDAFWLAYQQMRSKVDRGPLLIHFRWKTCGSANHTNTQPLSIYSDRLAMAHNGIFSQLSDHTTDLSDSVVLARLIKRVGWVFPFSKAATEMLEALCDGFNKLVFLDHRGRYSIINEKAGKWKRGCWYSDGASVWNTNSPRYAKSKRHGTTVDADLLSEAEWRALQGKRPRVDWDTYHQQEEMGRESVYEEPTKQRPGQPYTRRCYRIDQHGTPVVVPAGGVLKKTSITHVKRPNIPSGMPRYMMNTEDRIAYDSWVSYSKNVLGIDPENGLRAKIAANDFKRHSVVTSPLALSSPTEPPRSAAELETLNRSRPMYSDEAFNDRMMH